MPFSRKLLNDGEEVVLDLHPHWEYFVRAGFALLIALFVGVWALAKWQWESYGAGAIGIVLLVVLVWFGWTYLRWATINFVITTDRLIYRHGVVSKHGIEIPLDRVNTVFFSQSVLERIVGSGDLTIESAGEQGSQHFDNIRKPSAVQNEIYKQMEANENRKFDRVNLNAAAATMTSIPEQIAQLENLRQQGVLTDEEFAQKKQQLLDRM